MIPLLVNRQLLSLNQIRENHINPKIHRICKQAYTEKTGAKIGITSVFGFEMVRNGDMTIALDAARKLMNMACKIRNAISLQIYGSPSRLFHRSLCKKTLSKNNSRAFSLVCIVPALMSCVRLAHLIVKKPKLEYRKKC